MSSNVKKLFDVRELPVGQFKIFWSEYRVKDHYENTIKTINEFKNQMKYLKEDFSTKLDDGASLAKLHAYFDDLCTLEEKLEMCKFPLDMTTDLKYWLLFNIAVCQGNVATSQDVSTESGVELLQQCAGIFSYLQNSLAICKGYYGKSLPKVRLAQAQELLILKAMDENVHESDILPLVYWCKNIYVKMDRELLAEEMLRKDEYIGSFSNGYWRIQIGAKMWEFNGFAKFYESLKYRNDGNIGMAIAGMKEAIQNFKMAEPNLDSKIFKKIGSQAKKVLEEMENNFVQNKNLNYLLPISQCEGKQLAFMKLITNPMSPNFDGLFDTTASSAEDEIVNYMINAELKKLQEDDKKSKENPISLAVFKDVEMFKGDKLPKPITMKAKYIHEKGGVQGLRALMDESKQTLNQIHKKWTDSDHQLNEENMEDVRLRTQYKEKWTLPSSEKTSEVFRKKSGVFRDIIKKANSAEKSFQEMLNKNLRGIEFLSQLGYEFSDDLSVKHVKLINKMRLTMECDYLQKRFDLTKARHDTIKSKLESVKVDLNKQFADAPQQDQEIKWKVIEEALTPLRQDISDYLVSKQNLYAIYENLTFSCQKHKEGNSEAYFERYFEKMPVRLGRSNDEADEIKNGIFKELNEAYDCFITLNTNLEESKKFFSQFYQMLGTYEKDVTDFCSTSKLKRESLLKSFEEMHFVEVLGEESFFNSLEKDIIYIIDNTLS